MSVSAVLVPPGDTDVALGPVGLVSQATANADTPARITTLTKREPRLGDSKTRRMVRFNSLARLIVKGQSGSSKSTSTTVQPAARSWSQMRVARSTSDPMSEWLSAIPVRGFDGSWTIKASSSAWSRTEHQSCSSGDRRIRHSTRPFVVTSGGLVVISFRRVGYRRFSGRSARARRSTDEKKITTPTTRSTSGIDTSMGTEGCKGVAAGSRRNGRKKHPAISVS